MTQIDWQQVRLERQIEIARLKTNNPIICRDCKKPASPEKDDAVLSGRCDPCQVERDEYYNDKMRAEHGHGRRSITRPHEHSTYWGKP